MPAETEKDPKDYLPSTNALSTLAEKVYFHRLPSYANRIFYGLGFLALTSLVLLIVSGSILAFMGQEWWLFSPAGIYVRSVHLWSVQAFIAILILHMLVAFTTSAFKPPRRMAWVFGAIIFCLALIQTEFGYGLRGDFESQFRAVSGADFWNGAYLGYWFNPLSQTQTFVTHVAIIPIAILGLFVLHYLLVHTYGIAKPYRKDIKYKMVAADHTVMYVRGAVLFAAILVLAFFFRSPYVPAVTIADVARTNPQLVRETLLQEFEHTSDTATYMDSIDPYAFDTAQVFVYVPYERLIESSNVPDVLLQYESMPVSAEQASVAEAETFASATDTSSFASSTNPVILMLKALTPMTTSGLYQSVLDGEEPSENSTYSLRFLVDMGVPEDKASSLNMDTEQWGMVKDETAGAPLPPGSWWFMPLAVSNSLFDLPNNPNGDRIAGEILGSLMLVFIAFPYIPYLNRLPELLNIAPFIWKEPRMKEKDEHRE